MGRFVISLALASAFVVAGVAVVNRGINDRVKSIQRVAGLKVAPLSGWRFWVQLVWHMIALGPPIVAIVHADSDR